MTICSDGIRNFKNRFSFIFSPKIRVFSKKKKKDFYFDFISNFSIFFPKLKCSLKKKGFHFDFISNFLPKLRCSLKKKKKGLKVFTQNCSLHSEQTSAAD